MKISNQLDYGLYSNAERAEQVRTLFTPEVNTYFSINFNAQSTQLELDKVANFILYGKDPKTDKNFCQKKEIQIDQAHAAFRRKQAESLDALLENPTTHEERFKPVERNVYTHPKPAISREDDANVPGLSELWVIIDKLAERVRVLKEKNAAGLDFYKANHLLIQLRKEQFALKDAVSEPIRSKGYHAPAPIPANFSVDSGYVRDYEREATYAKLRYAHYAPFRSSNWREREEAKLREQFNNRNKDWEWVEVSENRIDLRDPRHVYALLEFYDELKKSSFEDLDCDTKYLLWELEDLIEKAHLSEARKWILIRKIDKATNDQIRDELLEKFGLSYSDNYISTIYKQMICGQIAKAAELREDSWVYRNQPEKFKICSTCGEKLLRDTRNFIRKRDSKDGLAARCKMCDKRKRDMKKKEAQNG